MYGGLAYGQTAYGGEPGQSRYTATDSWLIMDSASIASGAMARSASDGWSVGDVASQTVGNVRGALDGWLVSDVEAHHTTFYRRTAGDSWTIADLPPRVFFTQFIDLPETLALDPTPRRLTLKLGGSLALGPVRTLQLQSAPNSSTLDATANLLAVKEETEDVVTDG